MSSTRERKFTAEQLTHLFAIACEDPRESGRPISHRTSRELADEVGEVPQGMKEADVLVKVDGRIYFNII